MNLDHLTFQPALLSFRCWALPALAGRRPRHGIGLLGLQPSSDRSSDGTPGTASSYSARCSLREAPSLSRERRLPPCFPRRPPPLPMALPLCLTSSLLLSLIPSFCPAVPDFTSVYSAHTNTHLPVVCAFVIHCLGHAVLMFLVVNLLHLIAGWFGSQIDARSPMHTLALAQPSI